MCILRRFVSEACGHQPERLEPCSRNTICSTPMMTEVLSHPGECPECLEENFWPISNYDVVTEEYADPSDAPNNIIGYCQEAVGMLLIWTTHFFKSWGFEAEDQEMGLRGHALQELHKAVLQASYHQIRCQHCDRKPEFGHRCAHCSVTINVAREVRSRWVEQLEGRSYPGFSPEAMREIEDGFRHRPTPPARLVAHSWPFPREMVLLRHNCGLDCIKTLVEEITTADPSVCDMSEKIYAVAAGTVLQTMSWVMAHDSGVGPGNIPFILEHMAPLLRHPLDSRDPPQYSWAQQYGIIDFSLLRSVIAAYAVYVHDHFQRLRWMRIVVNNRLRETRVSMHQAMNERQSMLYTARLRHYTTPLAVPDTSPGWICTVCHEEHDGTVVKLTRCGHTFHFGCMSKCLLMRESSQTSCPLCRRTFDGLDSTGDWRFFAWTLSDEIQPEPAQADN